MRAFLLIMLIVPMLNYAQTISVFNANSVLDLIEQYSASVKSFKGNFVYQKNRNRYTGVITYVTPNKVLMQFGTERQPEDKKIVIDGNFVIVQEGNLIARQKLESGSDNPITAWNIRPLRREYIPVAPTTGLEMKYGDIDAYQVILEPKINTTSFRQIELVVDKDGLIRRIQGTSRVGDITTLSLRYIEMNEQYDDRIFAVNTTEDSQIYDNIFE